MARAVGNRWMRFVVPVLGRGLRIKSAAAGDLAALFSSASSIREDRVLNSRMIREQRVDGMKWLAAIQQVEGTEARGGLRGGIVGENDVGKQVIPVILPRGDVGGYHVSERVIKTFSEPVSLGMVRGRQTVHNGAGGEHLLKELCDKLASAVANEDPRCPVLKEDATNENDATSAAVAVGRAAATT